MAIFFYHNWEVKWKGRRVKIFFSNFRGGVENTSDPNHEHPILPTHPCT